MSHICNKIRGVASCLYLFRSFVTIFVRKRIVHDLSYSSLHYGLTVFAHCSESWHSRADAILKKKIS